MDGMRVSVRGVAALVALAAAGLAALRSGSTAWAAVTVTAVFAVLLASLVGVIAGRDRRAWAGFAVFGWGYWLITFVPAIGEDVRPALVTSALILEGYGRVHGKKELFAAPLRPGGQPSGIALARGTALVGNGSFPPLVPIDGRSDGGETPVARPYGAFMMTMAMPSYLAFGRTAHALFAAVFGLVGAGMALRVSRAGWTRPPRDASRGDGDGP